MNRKIIASLTTVALLGSLFAAQAGVLDQILGLEAPEETCKDDNGYGTGYESHPGLPAGYGYGYGYSSSANSHGEYGYGYASADCEPFNENDAAMDGSIDAGIEVTYPIQKGIIMAGDLKTVGTDSVIPIAGQLRSHAFAIAETVDDLLDIDPDVPSLDCPDAYDVGNSCLDAGLGQYVEVGEGPNNNPEYAPCSPGIWVRGFADAPYPDGVPSGVVQVFCDTEELVPLAYSEELVPLAYSFSPVSTTFENVVAWFKNIEFDYAWSAGAQIIDDDADDDGVIDLLDLCAETAPGATVDELGCPDSDGDGVFDSTDLCPAEVGDAPLGCPIAPPADSDGDLVPDDVDLCPTEAGPVAGCPPISVNFGTVNLDVQFQGSATTGTTWMGDVSWLDATTGKIESETQVYSDASVCTVRGVNGPIEDIADLDPVLALRDCQTWGTQGAHPTSVTSESQPWKVMDGDGRVLLPNGPYTITACYDANGDLPGLGVLWADFCNDDSPPDHTMALWLTAVGISVPTLNMALPGGTTTLTLDVLNDGAGLDNYDVRVFDANGDLDTDTIIDLAAGGLSSGTALSFPVAASANLGDVYSFTIEVRSQQFPDEVAQVPVTVVIGGTDADGDGVANVIDNCPLISNGNQADFDGDLVGDACDLDDDDDGVANGSDLCRLAAFATMDGCAPYINMVTGLAASATSSTVSLSWSIPAANVAIAHYEVFRDTTSPVATSGVATSTPVSAGMADTSLPPSTQYYYTVRATDGGSVFGGFSAEISTTTGATPPPPPPPAPLADSDGDGVADNIDNCPVLSNADQADLDQDGIGDVCDSDRDGDGILNDQDAFPDNAAASGDADGDGVDDGLDVCPGFDDNKDLDGDNIPDGCDDDRDGDGVLNANDPFPDNKDESADTDGDGVGDNSDLCPGHDDNKDLDGDGIPDGCDSDRDGDGIANDLDLFPDNALESKDTDGDGVGDNADLCPAVSDAGQLDTDKDGVGDACDTVDDRFTDADGDGLIGLHEIELGTDPTNPDTDGDGISDGREVDTGTNPLDPNDPIMKPLRALPIVYKGKVYTFFKTPTPNLADHFNIFLHSEPTYQTTIDSQTGKTVYLVPGITVPPGTHRMGIIGVALLGSDVYDAKTEFLTAAFTINGLDTSSCAGALDSDGDGICDSLELELGTDPNNADTDGDGISDGDEILGRNGPPSNPWDADSDGDNVNDFQERLDSTGPMDRSDFVTVKGPSVGTEWAFWVGLLLVLGCAAVLLGTVVAYSRRGSAAD